MLICVVIVLICIVIVLWCVIGSIIQIVFSSILVRVNWLLKRVLSTIQIGRPVFYMEIELLTMEVTILRFCNVDTWRRQIGTGSTPTC